MQSIALNMEVAFGLYGRHPEKSILRHNFAGDRLIETTLHADAKSHADDYT